MKGDFRDPRNPPIFPVYARSIRAMHLAVGLIALLMACSEFLNPQLTRPTGRWSFLFGPIWDAFGPTGLAAYWALAGLVFLAVDVVKGKK